MTTDRLRLDARVLSAYPNLSRSLIQKLIRNGYVLVDGSVCNKPGEKVDRTKRVEVKTDILEPPDDELKLDVLYEDENCVVVNKPAGILTHSKGAYNPEATVASWLQTRKQFDFASDNDRAGIVHRLDRATSGVIICAKNKQALGFLQKQFQDRKVHKKYIAKVVGNVNPAHAIIKMPLERNPSKPQTFRVHTNGKEAETEYKVISSNERYSLVELLPKTGRTHQLRVHLAHLKHPIVGDTLYGGMAADRMYLHAVSLELTIPGGIRKIFTIKPPFHL